jgi:hypothetical protein
MGLIKHEYFYGHRLLAFSRSRDLVSAYFFCSSALKCSSHFRLLTVIYIDQHFKNEEHTIVY